jgi:hypothetical protein
MIWEKNTRALWGLAEIEGASAKMVRFREGQGV